jgi:hypothetical protein
MEWRWRTEKEIEEESKEASQDIMSREMKTGNPVQHLRFFELVRRYFGHLIHLAYSLAHGAVFRRSKYFHQLVGHRDSALKRKHICVKFRSISWIYIQTSRPKAQNTSCFSTKQNYSQINGCAHENCNVF